MVSWLPSTSTWLASDTCGTPSRSASIAAITPIRASVDSAPAMTRSNPVRPSTAASAAEVCSPSEPASPSSIRWMALSAPMDSALRIDSLAFSGPMVRMVTSPPCASARRSPSSIAYSSSSLMTPSTEARSSVESSGRRVRSAQVSGTCFTKTTMFMPVADLLSHSLQPGAGPGTSRVPNRSPGWSPRGPSDLMLLAGSLPCLGLVHDVGQQHGPGHRANPTGHRGQVAGHLANLGGDVPDQSRLGPGDAHVQHGRAGPDHVRGDQAGPAGRDHHDVGRPGVPGQVLGPGVAL